MARPYAVHYEPSRACTFEWWFHAHWRYCGLLTHEWPDWDASRFKRSMVVRMINLCDGIGKSSAAACYTDLRVRFGCVWQLSGPLDTPLDCVFFPSFLPQLYRSLPKPRQHVITRSCPTSPTVEATQHSHIAPFIVSLHSIY